MELIPHRKRSVARVPGSSVAKAPIPLFFRMAEHSMPKSLGRLVGWLVYFEVYLVIVTLGWYFQGVDSKESIVEIATVAAGFAWVLVFFPITAIGKIPKASMGFWGGVRQGKTDVFGHEDYFDDANWAKDFISIAAQTFGTLFIVQGIAKMLGYH